MSDDEIHAETVRSLQEKADKELAGEKWVQIEPVSEREKIEEIVAKGIASSAGRKFKIAACTVLSDLDAAGYVVTRKEPTAAMLEAANPHWPDVRNMYRAMIAGRDE